MVGWRAPGVCLPRPEGMLRGGWAAIFSWPRYPAADITWLLCSCQILYPQQPEMRLYFGIASGLSGLSNPDPRGSRDGRWGPVSEGLFGGPISS